MITRRFRSCILAAAFALAAIATGCATPPTTPSHYAPYSQTDLIAGAGPGVASGNLVTVNYTGWFYDPSQPNSKGLQFDTSIGATPFAFTVGTGQVIAGWEQGIIGMQVGGTRELIVPPSLAYGQSRSGPVPGNSTLVFDITLLAIQ